MTPIQALHPAKPWWHSKTLWFNAVCTALAATETAFSLLQPMLPVNVYAVLAFALAVGNAVLRAVTTVRLTLGTPAAPAEPAP